MKKITPIQTWTVTGNKNADTINIIIVSDDLKNSLTTYYEIGYEEPIEESEEKRFIPLIKGNEDLSGQEYQDLDNITGIHINEEIKRKIISKLNLTLA